MPSSGENLVRLVIQSVCEKGSVAPGYRVIIYPERNPFRGPLKFSSREQLLQRLGAAMPGFDTNHLRQAIGATQIIFAGTVELSDAQLAKLFVG
jgi:hypothetical protein